MQSAGEPPERVKITLALIRLGGWRPVAPLTPGLVKDALAARFRNFQAFRLMPETRCKSGPTRHTGPRHSPPQPERR
jgi:hypothetical protein